MGTEASDDLLGGGAKPASFKQVGDTIEGVIEDLEKREDEDPTGKVKTWPNGDPMHVYLITLRTSLQENAEDDGTRTVWCRGHMVTAVRQAMKDGGLKKGQSPVGGTLKVQFSGLGEAKQRGFQPPKLFKARFTPGVKPVADIMSGGHEDEEIPF